MTIKIYVTRERYEEIFSIDDDLRFFELTNREAYDYMSQFCVGENGDYLSQAEARKIFKKIPRKEFGNYLREFIKAVGEAFVNPPNGADSSEP